MNDLSKLKDERIKTLKKAIDIKVERGFMVEEVNPDIPFVVVSKGKQKVNHKKNFLISFFTIGLWSFAWIYQCFKYAKEQKFLITIDQDGNLFEEKCFI